MRRNRSIRVFGVMLLLFILATATYAFTAGNTVPDSNAGFGVSDISGYTVTAIQYTISGNSLDGVSFTLTPNNDPSGAAGVPARFVSVEFSDAADAALGTFTTDDDCSITGTAVTCTPLGLTLEDVYGMDIAAVQ